MGSSTPLSHQRDDSYRLRTPDYLWRVPYYWQRNSVRRRLIRLSFDNSVPEFVHLVLPRSMGDRSMVGLQILDLAIGVRIPVSQPKLHELTVL